MSTMSERAQTVHAPRVVVLAGLGVLAAFIVQTAVLPAIGLSAVIPVVFAAVVVMAMALGRRAGAVIGFCAGLLLDLTGVGVLGLGALIGCLAGAYAGGIRTDRWRWSGLTAAWAATAVAAAAFTVFNGLVAGIMPGPSWSWLWLIAGSAACAVALVPVRPWIQAVVR